MSEPEQAEWSGASGKKYLYFVYRLPTNLGPSQDGNYIFTKVENQRWKPIYIGQGDLASRTNLDSHHQAACLRSKGVTHVHLHLNRAEQDRLAEERDLLAGHSQAYKPTGCNEKPGG